MLWPHEKLRIAGVVFVLFGLLCFPFPNSTDVNPYAGLSTFTLFADHGLLWKLGLASLFVGIVMIVGSLLIPRR